MSIAPCIEDTNLTVGCSVEHIEFAVELSKVFSKKNV